MIRMHRSYVPTVFEEVIDLDETPTQATTPQDDVAAVTAVEAMKESADDVLDSKAFFDYLKALNFKAEDIVCLSTGYGSKDPSERSWTDRFMPFGSIGQETFDQFAEYNRNGHGLNVYLSMATFKPGTTSRVKTSVSSCRHAFVDADGDFDKLSARIDSDVAAGMIPEPALRVLSSPSKGQIIWSLEPGEFLTADGQPDIGKHEGLIDALQERYQTDPAATDTARVLRVPGFQNVKYQDKPVARLFAVGERTRHKLTDFKITLTIHESKTEKGKAPPIPLADLDHQLSHVALKLREKGFDEDLLNRALLEIIEEQTEEVPDNYEQRCSKIANDAVRTVKIVNDIFDSEKTIPYGGSGDQPGHDTSLFNEGSSLRNIGMETETMKEALEQMCQNRCEGRGNDWPEMCERKAAQAMKYKPVRCPGMKFGDKLSKACTELFGPVNSQPAQTQELSVTESTETCQAELVSEWEYAITPEQLETELEKEYPVLPLIEQGGPTWTDDILYGVAGDIVRKATACSEGHPAGMYLDLLVSLGSMIGRGPYFRIGDTRHYTNEFMVRVGDSSKSRKGTGNDAIHRLLGMLDSTWKTHSGFGSAQAVIFEMRDARANTITNKKGESKNVIVPGVADKRLCIREGELGGLFRLAAMKESQADVILRDGWDGKPLHNIVKGVNLNGMSNSASVHEPHLSIVGDTTRSELFARMPPGAEENGFGNRFLYCYVTRLKRCPHGGPEIDWTGEVLRLMDVIATARSRTLISMSKAAHKMWARLYLTLDENRPASLAGKMTSRGPAHVRRLALILALLDASDEVEPCHLQAAKRLWDYCEESAEYIYGQITREERRILLWIEQKKVVSLSQIREDLYHRNRKSAWVRAQVTDIAKQGFVSLDGDQVKFLHAA